MKITHRSDQGCKVRVEDEDDLWTLAQVIRPGVIVKMFGHRRDQTTGSREGGRAKEAERKAMWLTILTESTEYAAFSDALRVTGIITEADFDQGSHHTHSIEERSEVELLWEEMMPLEDAELLQRAATDGAKARVLMAVVESDEIMLFEVTANGLRESTTFTMRGGGKRHGDSSKARTAFFEESAKESLLVLRSDMPLLLCGPGSAREAFADAIRKKGHSGHIRSVATSIGGRAAANEILREGLADDILGEHTLTRQTKLIEQAFAQMSTEGLVAYGGLEILEAAEQGAIETLLLLARLLRDPLERCVNRSWPDVAALVLDSGGEIEQTSEDHDAGLQLAGIGGAVALLRWKIE